MTLMKNGSVLTIERTFNGPVDMVWQAWTDAEVFAKWWGPDGWVTTVKEADVTPGGSLLYGMKCVDAAQDEWFGQESWGKMTYGTVNRPHELGYTDYFCDSDGMVDDTMPAAKTTMRLEEVDGRTKMTSVSDYPSEEALEQVLDMGMEEGLKQTLDHLEALLNAEKQNS